MQIKIGADPEFFVRENGQLVSAHGLIKGNKKHPTKVENGAVQVDGMALEFNIDPVVWGNDDVSFKAFNDNINSVLGQLQQMVGKNYEFDFSPVAHFGKGYIDAQPFEAKELGCDPDYNAYTGQPNPRPNGDMGFRTASGHIHIGWTEGMDINDPEHFEACCWLAKQLDVYLGVPSLVWDDDVTRASMYGRLGTFRPKPYGMEYRVLSNAWLKDVHLRKFVFTAVGHAFNNLMAGMKVYQNARAYNFEKNPSYNLTAYHVFEALGYTYGNMIGNDYTYFQKLGSDYYNENYYEGDFRPDQTNTTNTIPKVKMVAEHLDPLGRTSKPVKAKRPKKREEPIDMIVDDFDEDVVMLDEEPQPVRAWDAEGPARPIGQRLGELRQPMEARAGFVQEFGDADNLVDAWRQVQLRVNRRRA